MTALLRASFALCLGAAAASGCSRAQEPAAPPASSACGSTAAPRETKLLADGWRYLAGDGRPDAPLPDFARTPGEAVPVPHTWGWDPRRGSWYHTTFDARRDGRRTFVSFEGVGTRADVYVNGTRLGQHVGAFTRFTFDASTAVADGPNVLAVRVSNHPDDTVDSLPSGTGKQLYRMYGGLYRKVWLVRTAAAHFDLLDHASSGVYVTPTGVTADTAELEVRTRIRGSGGPEGLELVTRLCDADGREVAKGRVPVHPQGDAVAASSWRSRVEKPALWSPAAPHLYRVQAELWSGGTLQDRVEERTGFRDFRFEDGRFLLNGQPILLRGVGKHQETESRGAAVTDDDLREDFASLKDLGVNFVRLAHYPHAKLEYDLADELGLLVWAENGHSNSAKVDVATGETITREMVRQNYNHPSIVMWSVGNETAFVRVAPFAAVAKAEDAHRLVVYASNTGVQGRKRQPDLDLIAHNVYRGWYRGEPWDFEERALEVKYVAESGGGSVVSNHTDHTAARHLVDAFEPEEYRQELAEVHFQTVFRDHPQEVPLYLVWILRDFAIDKYKGRNTKGLLTGAGFEKDAYYLYRSFLRPDEPLVHLTSKTRFLRSGRPDDGVKVYSNRPALTLYLNGVSQGERPNDAYNHRNGRRVANVFHWRAGLSPGRNEVRVTDGAGHEDRAVVYYHAPPEPMPADGGDPIERLRSSNPRSPAYFIRQPIQPQWPFYWAFDGSADNGFDRIPAEVAGASWISTPRLGAPENRTELSFVMRRDADVFVMATAGARAFPGQPFQELEATGAWRDNDLGLVPYRLSRLSAQAGTRVRIPAVTRDYVVLVKESE
ncbi:MAG: glycoside hydrolase family 2 TIM barrel-domain containing protein [Vicinamibacteria bacterium]